MGHYLLQEAPKTGTGDLLISVQAVEPLRIPIPNTDMDSDFSDLLKTLLKESSKENEKKLNNKIYEIYKLNKEEIKFIENFT